MTDSDRVYGYEEVVSLIENEVIPRKGEDYIYDGVDGGCMYKNDDGSPSCIIGHLFDVIGVLPDFPERGAENCFGFGSIRNLPSVPRFTCKAASYLAELQIHQDRPHTWGDANRKAKELVSGYGDLP